MYFFFLCKGGGIMWFSGAHNSSLKKIWNLIILLYIHWYRITCFDFHCKVSNLQNLQKLYDNILVKIIFYSYSYFLQMRLLTESMSLDSGLQHKKKRI